MTQVWRGGLVPPWARATVSAQPRGHASPAPSGPSAGLTRRSPAPSTSEPRSVRESVPPRVGFPPRERPLLSSGCAPPEPSSEQVLGPFVPRAVTPRVRSSFTNSARGYLAQSGVSPSPRRPREGQRNGGPASAIVDVRRRRSCRLSAAVPDPHDLRPGRVSVLRLVPGVFEHQSSARLEGSLAGARGGLLSWGSCLLDCLGASKLRGRPRLMVSPGPSSRVSARSTRPVGHTRRRA
jgi:hypothetical protein